MIRLSSKLEKKHIDTLDFLRGIAALSVVLFHFSNSTLPTIKPNPLGDFFSLGNLGVQVFFVISGFVIPYSMYQSGYTLPNAFRFLAKRMVRLGPPSWIAMALMAIIYYGAIQLNGKPIEGMDWPGNDWTAILGNMFYAYASAGIGTFYSVLWTLEVELQYYLLIAFLLPLLVAPQQKAEIILLILAAVALTFFLNDSNIIFFKYNSLFIMGILVFLFKIGKIDRKLMSIACCVIVAVCHAQLGYLSASSGAITLLIITFVNFKNGVAQWLGMISYSLYITHHFAGISTEFIVKKFLFTSDTDSSKVLLLFLYTAIALTFAHFFYKWVEKPFIRLASKIKFKEKAVNRG